MRACRHAPFLIPFEERARIFQAVIAADRSQHREMGAFGPQSFLLIHRATLMKAFPTRLVALQIASACTVTASTGRACYGGPPLHAARLRCKSKPLAMLC